MVKQSQRLHCAHCRLSTQRKENIYMVLFDLEKACDTVPSDLIWWLFRNIGIPEQYVAIIQDMYHDTKTKVKTRCDTT